MYICSAWIIGNHDLDDLKTVVTLKATKNYALPTIPGTTIMLHLLSTKFINLIFFSLSQILFRTKLV